MIELPPDQPEKVGLPPVTFLYTLDQIAVMLQVPEERVRSTLVHYHMRSTGRKSPHQMLARNIADPAENPDWRIPQAEFVRWLKLKGIRVFSIARLV